MGARMKLEAAHRLLAADKTQQLKTFIDSLSDEQKDYFFIGLPAALKGWFMGLYEQKLHPDDIVFEASTKLEARYDIETFKRFIKSMILLRPIFPPRITHGKIYRLTAVKKKPEGPTAIFSVDEQYRSLTSWTLRSSPQVFDRQPNPDFPDIVLCYELENPKNVLFDIHSVLDLIDSAIDISPGYDRGTSWRGAYVDTADFVEEEEVALYLNLNQKIECTWRPT